MKRQAGMEMVLGNIQEVKLEIFIPIENIDSLRQALADAGAGQVGKYDNCCAVMEVRGYWRPLPGANPFQGEVGKVETSLEAKVEVNCKRALVNQTIQAIRAIHPYEEPVINIIPLINHLFSE